MKTKRKIIIVGAGIAGLAAADQLSSRWDVTVLEARERLGGRIYTDRSWGAALDLGAQVIHGIEHNPIADLAAKLKLKTVPADFRNFYLYEGLNQILPDALMQQYAKKFETIIASLPRHADTPDIVAENAMGTHPLTVAIHPDMLDWFKKSEAVYSGAELSRHAAKYYQQQNEYAGANVMFPNGYDQILRAFEHLQDAHILRCQVVTKIMWDATGVMVTTNRGSFIADFCLITLPLGVLQSGKIQFEPELPEWKQNAIQKLGMGVLDLVYLKFPEAFWPTDRDFIGVLKSRGGFSRFVNRYRTQQIPVLAAVTGGDTGRHMESLPDAEVVAHAMEGLRAAFGNQIPEPVDQKITRWAADPFARGSYSYIPVGASLQHYQIMAQPVGGRLFFAGEATHKEHPCTVHGAYLSGLREAERLLNLMRTIRRQQVLLTREISIAGRWP